MNEKLMLLLRIILSLNYGKLKSGHTIQDYFLWVTSLGFHKYTTIAKSKSLKNTKTLTFNSVIWLSIFLSNNEV